MSEHFISFSQRDEILDDCYLLFNRNNDLNDYQKYRLHGMLIRNLFDVYERSIQPIPYNSPTYKAMNPEERLRGFAQIAAALGDISTAHRIYSIKNQIKLDSIYYHNYEVSTIPKMVEAIEYPTDRFGIVLAEYSYANFHFHQELARKGQLGESLRDPIERIRANAISLATISWDCSMDSYKIIDLLSSMTLCALGEELLD